MANWRLLVQAPDIATSITLARNALNPETFPKKAMLPGRAHPEISESHLSLGAARSFRLKQEGGVVGTDSTLGV